jgi:hypothetical protein
MPERKPAPRLTASAFTSADRLLKEDRQKSDNERRLERWADVMVRERKLDPGWKEDRDAAVTVRWIGDRNAAPPAEKAKKSTGKKA